MFLLKANLYDGAYEMLRATSATSILNTYLQPKGMDYWVAGSMLTSNQDGTNSSAIYAGIVKNTLDSEKLITTVSGDFSQTKAISASATGGAYVLGNFAGLLDLGHNHQIRATSADINDVFVLKLDAEARVSWIKNFGSANADEAIGLAPMPDGGVVIAYAEGSQGYVSGLEKFEESAPDSGKVKLIHLGANGEMLWERLLKTTSK